MLGPSFHVVIMFHLKRQLNHDPYEVLWEDPYAFYAKLRELFGYGAETIVRLVGKKLAEKYAINFAPEELQKLMTDKDESSKNKLRKILAGATPKG